jgi:hypothetical protein
MISLAKPNDHRTSAFRLKHPPTAGSDPSVAEESTLSRAAAGFENFLEGLLILQITVTQRLPSAGDESTFGQNSPHGGGNLPSSETCCNRDARPCSLLLPTTRLICCLALRGPGDLWTATPRRPIPPVTAMHLSIDGFSVAEVEWKETQSLEQVFESMVVRRPGSMLLI